MGIIRLEKIKFHAYHGFYEEERKSGNTYYVDVKIEADLIDAQTSDILDNTIDYEEIYKIVKTEMAIPSRLIEHVGNRILETIFQKFEKVENVGVKITKMNPPIGGICASSSIELEKGSTKKKKR